LLQSRGFGAPETTAAFARAAELAAGIEDAAERFLARYGLWAGSLVRGEPEAMRTLSAAFLRDAEREPNSPELMVGHRMSAPAFGIRAIIWGLGSISSRHSRPTMPSYTVPSPSASVMTSVSPA
jgi:hypothetical protein